MPAYYFLKLQLMHMSGIATLKDRKIGWLKNYVMKEKIEVLTKEDQDCSINEDLSFEEKILSSSEAADDLDVYAVPKHSNTNVDVNFPSVKELLDCDSPWIEEMLTSRLGIDKMLVVPDFKTFTLYMDKIDPTYTIVGIEEDGQVWLLKCDNMKDVGPAIWECIEYRHERKSGDVKLSFWEGQDVSAKWPVFKNALQQTAVFQAKNKKDFETCLPMYIPKPEPLF